MENSEHEYIDEKRIENTDSLCHVSERRIVIEQETTVYVTICISEHPSK